MRSAVAASTVSGLLVAVLTAALQAAFGSGLSWRSFVPWALAVAGWVLAASLLLLRRWSRAAGSRRVFLIVAAFTQKHWVAELIRDLHDNLERRGYDLVLKIPDRDYSGVSQLRLLERIRRGSREYAGGLIMANEADGIQGALTAFCGSSGIPVVFLDSEPFAAGEIYPQGTAFVGYDDATIGEAAASWVAGYLRRAHIKRPCVLVINGGYYHQRERRFAERLSSGVKDVQLIDDCAGFDREQAREVIRTHLRRLASAGRKLDAVFCTNDEMALGVTDALQFTDAASARETVVVGVDGTPQARALIEAGPGPLRATVFQDSYKVAETAVRLLERMIRKETVPPRTALTAEIIARD